MEQIEAFRHGTLPAEELATTASHLAECEECHERALQSRQIRDVAFALHKDLSAWEHPSIDDLFAFVDETLIEDRRSEVAGHIEQCTRCREDVDDVRGPAKPKDHRPIIGIAAALAITFAASWYAFRPPPTANPPAIAPRPNITLGQSAAGEWDVIANAARHDRRLAPPPVLAELRDHGDVLRGTTTNDMSMVTPSGVVVVSQQPELRWSGSSTERYEVTVGRDETIVTRSGPIKSTSWRVTKNLPRGANYVWEVERLRDHAILPAPPAPQAAFRILDESAYSEIVKAESHQPRDEFVVGVLYARAGVQDQAVVHLTAHLATHPDDTAAAEILKSVKSW